MNRLEAAIIAALTNDLRRPPWRGNPNPLAGHCYVASEALWHKLPDRSQWTPCYLAHEGVTHWFLRHQTGLIRDLTAAQFENVPSYADARGCGFLTKQPSKRAQVVLDRLPSDL